MADRLRVVLRDLAQRDVEDIVDWYRDEADSETALRFVSALGAALDHVASHPRTGSPRYATELDLQGLRSWPLGDFPLLVFHVVADGDVDVWRVLNGQRDTPAWLNPSDDLTDTE